MSEVNISEWNRSLISKAIVSLERAVDANHDVISRLREFLAVNPGEPTVPDPKSQDSNGITTQIRGIL